MTPRRRRHPGPDGQHPAARQGADRGSRTHDARPPPRPAGRRRAGRLRRDHRPSRPTTAVADARAAARRRRSSAAARMTCCRASPGAPATHDLDVVVRVTSDCPLVDGGRRRRRCGQVPAAARAARRRRLPVQHPRAHLPAGLRLRGVHRGRPAAGRPRGDRPSRPRARHAVAVRRSAPAAAPRAGPPGRSTARATG